MASSLFIIGLYVIGLSLIGGMTIILLRGTVLFFCYGSSNGWLESLYRYKFSVALCIVLLFFEACNFSGFSWSRVGWVPEGEIINVAIRYNYPDIYSNQADLKRDYSSFTPQISYWKDWTGENGNMVMNKLFGMRDYQVRLPDAVVIVDANGKARYSRSFVDESTMIPNHPKLGIVGTVQYAETDHPVARDFSIRWVNGSTGKVFISGHCFSAFSESEKPALEISAPDRQPLTIEKEYGYRLAVIFLTKTSDVHGWYQGPSSMKIPETIFLKSQTCDTAVRKEWPNVGGYAWKR